jgi:8-oxo-dGTP pyrophosphatase MutT (NUDIX family)
VIEQLRQQLAQRQKVHITNSPRIPAGVLIPIFIRDGQYHILFIQRTDRVRDHKSQISFPGGAYEKADGTMLNTALREAEEEIGLHPGDVQVLGELDDMATAGTNYVISPVVGLIPYPYNFKVDQFETEEIIEVPLTALMDKNCMEEGTALVDGQPINSYFYHYKNRTIWGATARILKQFLEIISDLVQQGVRLETE